MAMFDSVLIVSWAYVALHLILANVAYQFVVLPYLARESGKQPRDAKYDDIANFKRYITLVEKSTDRPPTFYFASYIVKAEGFGLPVVATLAVVTVVNWLVQ